MNSIVSTDNVWRPDESMARLAQVSEYAKLYFSGVSLYIANVDAQHVFTPSPVWGVIHNEDESFLGFNSNYIQWVEGTCNNMPDEKYPTCYRSIYLCGVTNEGLKQYILLLSNHFYKTETIVVRKDPDIDIRRVDFLSKGQYTLLSDTEPTLHERYVIVKKDTDEVLDDIDGCCATSVEKAINHYNYIKNQNKQ